MHELNLNLTNIIVTKYIKKELQIDSIKNIFKQKRTQHTHTECKV